MDRVVSPSATSRSVAGCALAIVLLSANVTQGFIVACNETQVYSQMASCTSTSDPCIINDQVICGATCGDTCEYYFGETKHVRLSGNLGSFVNASFNPKNIIVTTGSVTTTGENVVRFEAGGGNGTLNANLEVTANLGSVDLYPGQIRNTGVVAGSVTYVRGATGVTLGKVDTRATGSTEVGGTMLLATPGDLYLKDTIDGSGPNGGAFMLLQGNRVFVQADVIAKATATGSAGDIQIITVADLVPSQPSIEISAPITASVTASTSSADGGSIFIGKTPGHTWEPTIVISDAVNANATLGDAGSITIQGMWVNMNATPSELNAAASSNAGTHGGTIDVTTTSTTHNSYFRLLDVRGHHGGTVRMRVANALTQFDKDVHADSNQSPDGVGGVISVRTAANNGVTNCWDCQEPGDSCACGVPPTCTQTIQINEDLIANGNGSSAGDGGAIILEAPYVYMRATGATRRLIANATTGTESTSGDQPGRIRVRARDSQFRARTNTGTDHKIRALPDKAGINEICITQPFGGDYKPTSFATCGPSYAPQCSPG